MSVVGKIRRNTESMTNIPFSQRFGFEESKQIADDFPESAKLALGYLLADLQSKRYLVPYSDMVNELARTGRFSSEVMQFDNQTSFVEVYFQHSKTGMSRKAP
ncbi:MAG: hypothetical protein GY861_12405 [bacterium]|nr:hypothetical protein [bacterium]